MVSNREMKLQQVAEIVSKLTHSKTMAIFEYKGLTVQDLRNLRKELKPLGIEVKVYKNRLFKIALDQTSFKSLKQCLTGPNIFVFGQQEENILAKKVFDFINQNIKTHPDLKIKGGIYEGSVIDAASFAEVAQLPSYEEAIGKLIMTLLNPLVNASLVLNALNNKLSEQQAISA